MNMQVVSEKKKLQTKSLRKEPGHLNDEPSPYKWTVDRYYRLGDLGFFEGKRVELIRGDILEMAPMKTPHAVSIQLLFEALSAIFAKGFTVRPQLPLGLSKANEPEPDIAVVSGSIRDYLESHPASALLVAEVSDATLQFDRTSKGALYAEFGIQEYWIVNVKDRQLEVNRKPSKRAANKFYYAEQTIYREDQSIAPLAKPKAKIKVADILP